MLCWAFLLVLAPAVAAIGEDDLVTDLPGLTFDPKFAIYSGYLFANANQTWKMHYWLTESRSNPATDPLLVWFNGGPGCSSFAGSFEELGPFYINKDGKTLYENVHSWNQRANVLYLEAPIGVGFSYATDNNNYTLASDDQTLAQNLAAITDFFKRVQPQYADRTWFLSGESYAGLYIPMLTDALITQINADSFPNKNFQGAAIGNGFMNVPYLLNSVVLWSFYHGRLSLDDWETVKAQCKGGYTGTDIDKYNFQAYFTSINNIDFVSDGSPCGNLLAPLLVLLPQMDQYNYYQDCYTGSFVQSPAEVSPNKYLTNTATTYNYDSTDNQWGYACWNENAMYAWANNRDVQNALHIADDWQARKDNNGQPFPWTDCNMAIYNSYVGTYHDTYQFFDRIIKNNKNPNFHMLIYNGDVDTVCNYLGDAWHIRDVANNATLIAGTRDRWMFRNQTAGFVQRYASKNFAIDVLTVKGAGHMVPNDRPGPSVQMITNFMFPNGVTDANGLVATNYSSTAHTNPTPTPLPLKPDNSATTTTTTVAPTTTSAAALLGLVAFLLPFF